MRNDCPVRCLRTAFRTCREDPILSAANEKSGRKRLIYAICCDRIVIPIYGAFSSRRTADIPGVHRIGGARRVRPKFCAFGADGNGFFKAEAFPKPVFLFRSRSFQNPALSESDSAPKPKRSRTEIAVYHLHCRRRRRKGRIKWHHTEIFIHIPNSATDEIRWKKWRRRRSIRECTR